MIVVRDIMQTDIVSVRPDMKARQLARKLADEDISGVPVTNSEGTLVGVVSQTDLVRLAARAEDVHLVEAAVHFESGSSFGNDADPDDEPREPDPYGFFLPEESPFAAHGVLDTVPESQFDMTTVEEIMTPAFYAVPPELPVPELADYLARGRIQRAVVVQDGRLVGIVTASDVLRAVADGSLLGQATDSA